MKILIYGDCHWSQYSSIVRGRGEKFSLRLENLIKSINWAESLAEEEKCFMVVCLGDFFDKAELNSEELTALKSIKWAGMSHYFLVGNHEMAKQDLSYSSSHLFNLLDTAEVIDKPSQALFNNVDIRFLPYILESNREPLNTYFEDTNAKKRIIFSHNDIKGIQMGKFISESGFDIEEIEDNCDLFINGHLHNGAKITNKIINCGNLTGQNFSEDAMLYDHTAFILDTDTMKVAVYENPYAFNFYKIDVTKWVELGGLQVKNNSVCTVKCKQKDAERVKEWIKYTPNVIESRIIIEPEIGQVEVAESKETFSVNHIQEFCDYISSTLGNSEIVLSELKEICV